jgi:hypothetical protein
MSQLNLQRFWYERSVGAEVGTQFFDSKGYLVEPFSDPFVASVLVPFSVISAYPCLVLLGDPGMGKTTALQAECKRIEATKSDYRTCWFDLADHSDEGTLRHQLFDNKSIAHWKNDNSTLHLFLDSLDECQLRIETIAKSLIAELRGFDYPLDRLRLRIICRTNGWDTTLEKRLKELFTTVGIYQLAPLTKLAISFEAAQRGLDYSSFINAIEDKGVVSLAVRPLTLDFLLRTYKSRSGLPSRQDELFFEGCKLLCEEFQQGHDLHRSYDTKHLFKIASRLATFSVFSHREHIVVDPRAANGTDEYLSVEDLTAEEEYLDRESYAGFAINKRAVQETLQTALFSSLRPGFRSWSHHSYPEFPAACYVHRSMSFEQMVSLITYSDGTQRIVVPQLQETAAWLASMDSRIFELIVSNYPELLLRSTVMLDEEDQRQLLTQRLLEHYESQQVGRFDFDLHNKLSKLNHPLLMSQLSSYIRNRDQKRYVREKAIEIALACKLHPLASGFADIALDQSEALELRIDAAFAAASIGDKNVKIRLKPLALGAAGDDPDEELKGYGLKALWPDLIAIEEVFPLITPPKNRSFSGSYHSFIFSDLIKHLDPHDLPKALSEVGRRPDDYAWGFEFPYLEDQIILKALEHLELKGVASSLARAILRRLKRAHKVVTEERSDRFRSLIRDETKRRALLLVLLRVISSDSDIGRIAFPEQQLVLGSDLPWILTRIRKARTEKTKLKLGYLAFLVFDWRNLEHICLMIEAYEAGELLGHRFELLLSGIAIDSPEGQQFKKEHEALQRRPTQAKSSIDDRSLQAVISKQLAEVESGSCDAWVNLTITLTGSSGTHRDNLWFDELDMTDQRGWISATEKTRSRITRAAYRYLYHFEFDQTHWKNKKTFAVFAGCKAIALLLANSPAVLENAAARDLWVKWTPAVLTVAEYYNKNEDVQRQIVKLAYHHAPDTVLAILSILIGNSAPRNAYAILDKFSGFWDGRLSDIVVKQAEDRQLVASGLGPLLDALFEHDPENARKLIKSLVSNAFTEEQDEVKEAKAAEAVSVCLGQANNQCLNLAWTAMRRSSKLGRRALERSVATMRIDKMKLYSLDEKTLAEMYIWLENEYPPETSPHNEARWAASQGGINDRVSLLKSSILTHLAGLGSQAAVTSLQELVYKLPDTYGPKLALVDAKQALRDRLWIPAEPKQIKQLIMDQSKRLVKNEAELIDLLIEELRAMEKKLHGDPATVKYLWDKRGEAFAPKPEEYFSDWIKMHLDQNIKEKGVIAQREVQIRRERADVFVTAIKQDHLHGKYEELKVVIEVKCCWSDALETVMETQLVDRYLKKTEYGGGIFVVGWYYCDKWDKTDYKRGDAQRHWMGDPQTFFDQQAAALSTHEFLVRSLVINTALD